DPESIIVVCPHWQGLDYKWASKHSRIKNRCRTFIDAGANYIFSHGTHMMNDIEQYNGGTIAYSIGNFVFNSPGRYKKLQAPPYSLIVNTEVQEDQNGQWTVKNKFYPILTDNKATNFNVRKINKQEASNLNSNYEKDELGIFINNTENETVNEILEIIIGKKEVNKNNFKDIRSIEEQIQALNKAQDQIYDNLNDFYYKLTRAKHMKKVEKDNYHLYDMLSNFIKTDFITHNLYHKFGRRKLNITNTISFQNIIVQ